MGRGSSLDLFNTQGTNSYWSARLQPGVGAERSAKASRSIMSFWLGPSLQRREQSPVNTPEAAIRHQDYQIARPGLAHDGVDDGVDGVEVPGALTARVHIADELRNRESLGV